MKTTLFISIFLVVGIIACQKRTDNLTTAKSSLLDTVSFSQSMKGWELYSLRSGNNWLYSILMGTNRGKSYDEVALNNVKVIGTDSLKMLLAKLPANENITWRGTGWLPTSTGDHYNLTLPDISTVNEIKDFCAQKGLIIYVSN